MAVHDQRPLPERPRGRQLGACIFCGDSGVTQEHLVADWALRAFTRQRKPFLLSARLGVGGEPSRVVNSSPTLAAGVTCLGCNNGWISTLDREASELMKPLVRGNAVTLSPNEQAITASWIFKTALICDVADHGENGPLASLRTFFMADKSPPPGCVIYVGSSRPYGPGAFPFGVRQVDGVVRLTVNVMSADGQEVTPGTPVDIPNPAFQVMVGAMTAFICGSRIPPISSESLIGFERVWPLSDDAVMVIPQELTRLADLMHGADETRAATARHGRSQPLR